MAGAGAGAAMDSEASAEAYGCGGHGRHGKEGRGSAPGPSYSARPTSPGLHPEGQEEETGSKTFSPLKLSLVFPEQGTQVLAVSQHPDCHALLHPLFQASGPVS